MSGADKLDNEVTLEDLKGFLGEGFHTALRKAVDSGRSDKIWMLIDTMPDEDWDAILTFVARPLMEAYKIERRSHG